MKKKTIHFNDETLKEIAELINLLGIEGYGDIPKALKFSVTFTLQEMKNQVKVIPDMNKADIEMWFSSIKKLRKYDNSDLFDKKVINGLAK